MSTPQPQHRLTQRERRLAYFTIGVLIGITIIAGAGYGIYATTTDNVPATGGNQWVEIPLSGGNEWMQVPVEGGNSWLTIPIEAGNDWLAELDIVGYEMVTEDFGDGYQIIGIVQFDEEAREVVVRLLLEDTADSLARWLKDSQQDEPTAAQEVVLEALDAEGELIAEWTLTDVLLVAADDPKSEDDSEYQTQDITLWYQTLEIAEASP